MAPGRAASLLVVLTTLVSSSIAGKWIDYPSKGTASMTHNPPGAHTKGVFSCGCNWQSNYYPIAALNEYAFGSSNAYGPACGRCFRLTLANTYYADPPFFPENPSSVVVKIADECPANEANEWCLGAPGRPNMWVSQLRLQKRCYKGGLC